jgi:Phage virion morphogenesis family
VSLSGDISQLGRIGAHVASLADVPRIAQPLASERIEQLIQLEFDAGTDPYGAAWEPLAKTTIARGRHEPPLTDTRELRESVLVYPSRDGIRVTVGTKDHPAGPHQTGWSGPQGSGPARPILPEGDMPDAWANAIEDAVLDAVIEKMRGAA